MTLENPHQWQNHRNQYNANARSKWVGNGSVVWNFEGPDTKMNTLSPPWLELNDVIRVLGLANAIRGDVEEFLKVDMNWNGRNIYRDILPPLQDDRNLLMCGFCDQGFPPEDKNRYYEHAAAHHRGGIHFIPCCLISFDKAPAVRNHVVRNPDCGAKEQIQRHGPFTKLTSRFQDPIDPASWENASVEHQWRVLVLSVRFSGTNDPTNVKDKMDQLRHHYMKGFRAEVYHQFELPQAMSGQSSR